MTNLLSQYGQKNQIIHWFRFFSISGIQFFLWSLYILNTEKIKLHKIKPMSWLPFELQISENNLKILTYVNKAKIFYILYRYRHLNVRSGNYMESDHY